MKSPSMSAVEFRGELKRLQLNQSSFAAAAEVPLRTVQSWALGERAIPRTARALIEKVERMSPGDMIIAIAEILPAKKLKALTDVAQIMSDQAKELKAHRDELRELRGIVSKQQGELDRLQQTCVFQANKLTAYEQDLRRRAERVVPFNN